MLGTEGGVLHDLTHTQNTEKLVSQQLRAGWCLAAAGENRWRENGERLITDIEL